jgi:glycosyltransferase involved in cell wall biosynthesis
MSESGASTSYHIVLNHRSDLGVITRQARDGLNPRHSMAELATELNATVHDGTGLTVSRLDRILAKASITEPLWWAIARNVRSKVAPGDVVFCTGEDVGLPVAMLCGGPRRSRVAIMAHSVDSPKKHLALRLFRANRRVSLFIVVCERQAEALRRYLGNRADRVSFVWDQTDTGFFTPGPASPDKRRPVIMSVGLERRDYATLATATADLDLDVRISGYSADTRAMLRAFPEVMPDNMTRRFYRWTELLQLYRDADVVVVSLFPNDYAAGVQGLMEGLSSGRPVIVTSTNGLMEYLQPADAMRIVTPGDAEGIRRVIVDLLGNPAARERLSSNARVLARSRHTCEAYVKTLGEKLRALNVPR